jgi:phage replication O-like protein O
MERSLHSDDSLYASVNGLVSAMSGFEKPNYTQTPNAFYDKLLTQIDSITELKVTLAIIRKTFGYHKDNGDKISLSQLEEVTGLPRKSVVDGINRSLKRGSIVRRKSGKSFIYCLKVVTTGNQEKDTDSYQRLPVTVTTGNHQVVTTGNPQKKDRKKRKEIPVGAPAAPDAASADEFIAYLAEELDNADVPLLQGRKARYGKEFKEQLGKGATPTILYKAADRVVERWFSDDHRKLTLEQAMEDVVNGKSPAHTNKVTPLHTQTRSGEKPIDPGANTEAARARRTDGYEELFA